MHTGTIVGGRFAIERLAGRGGMGLVYRARDTGTGEEVAVKALGCSGAEYSARFARESTLLSRLAHPAIVRFVAQGSTPAGAPFLVTEWLEGESLAQRFERGALTISETVALGTRIADALAAAHAQGVVHRDLKPSNLFLPGGRPEMVKLLDFGISLERGAPSLTMTGAMMGTPGYMAPEQARGERGVDARADIFALGCVLFRCLAARAPFLEDTAFALMLAINTADAPRVSTLVAGVPPALDSLIAWMLARRPADRPADASLVARELRRLADAIDDEETTDSGTRKLESNPGPAPQRDTGTVLMAAVPRPVLPTVRELPIPMPLEPIPPTVPWGAERRGRFRGWLGWTIAVLLVALTMAVAAGVIFAT